MILRLGRDKISADNGFARAEWEKERKGREGKGRKEKGTALYSIRIRSERERLEGRR